MSSARMAFLNRAADLLRAIPSAPTVEVGEDRIFNDPAVHCPWVGLLPAPGSKIERDIHDGGAMLSFRVFLYGYVQGDGTTSRSELLVTLVEEAQQALYQAGGAFHANRPGTTCPYAD
jgi:hypothetical protein